MLLFVWWFIVAKGFPLGHAKWWTNQVLPPVGACVCLAGLLLSYLRNHQHWSACILLAIGAAWLGISGACAGVFPQSMLAKVVFPLMAGVFIVWRTRPRSLAAHMPYVASAAAVVGLIYGAASVVLQRAGEPATRPSNVTIPPLAAGVSRGDDARLSRIGRNVTADPRTGFIQARIGNLDIGVQPLLQFISKSCLLYTSPSPRDGLLSRMPSSA